METIDLTADVEQPKAKTKAKAKAKAKAEPTEQTEVAPSAEPKAKAKPRAKPKAKPVAEPPIEKERWVDVRSDDEPPAVETAPAEIEATIIPPSGGENEPPIEQPIEYAEAATTTRKPKGHRPKIENKEKLTKKVNCKKCDKTVSLHSIKYTHDKYCNPPPTAQMEEPVVERPPTLREKLNEKRLATAQRLISQCFKP